MNIWKVNQENVITIIGSVDSDLRAYYVLDNSNNNFTSIPGSFSYNEGRYFLKYTFTSPGTYIIKVVDLNGNLSDMYSKLIVADEDYSSLVSLYKSDTNTIKNSLSSLTTLVNDIPTYEEIDGLAGLTSEEHSKLMSITLSPADIWSYSTRVLSEPSGLTDSQNTALNTVLSKVDSLDLLKFTQPEKTQLLSLVNYNDNTVQTQLDYISDNIGLTVNEHNQLMNLTNVSIPDIWSYASRTLTSGLGLTTEQYDTLKGIETSIDEIVIQHLIAILQQDALLADKDDISSIQNVINLIKTKTDTLSNYSDTAVRNTLDEINDKVTVSDTKIDTISTKIDTQETFTSTDRSKLNSLSNYNDSTLTNKIDEQLVLLDSVSGTMAKESTLNQVKQKVDSLINFDDTDIINILNSLPLLPQIKQELVNVQYGKLIIDPVLNKMQIFDKTSGAIIAEYMLYDNLGNLNSSRVFRREPL